MTTNNRSRAWWDDDDDADFDSDESEVACPDCGNVDGQHFLACLALLAEPEVDPNDY